jgi:hypothetical protein
MARWRRGSPVTNLRCIEERPRHYRGRPQVIVVSLHNVQAISQRASHFTTSKPWPFSSRVMAAFETCRGGLTMSADWGTPGVTGSRPKRCV